MWRITDAVHQGWWSYDFVRWRGRFWACTVVFVAFGLGGALLAGAKPSKPITAALKPITGRLDKPGYTVIALAANGQAGSVIAQGGSFSVVPPATKVTLQLRAPDGIYAGPVVLQEKGAKRKPNLAIVGVRAGAPIGAVTVNSAAGYALARLTKRAWKTWVDTTRWARAKNGVPIGAGNFGRVLAKPPRVPPPGDMDADGIPDALDIDVNGNLILNDVERTATAAARASQAAQGSTFTAVTGLFLPGNAFGISGLTQPVNANAPGVGDGAINDALVSDGSIGMGVDRPDHPYLSGELDCGGLTYCSAGGTGVHLDALFPHPPNPKPFPSCCDANGNGLGSLDVNPTDAMGVHTGLHLLLAPHASADQIRGGDVLLIHATCKPDLGHPCSTPAPGEPPQPPPWSSQAELTTTLASVFATVPALASYTDALGTHEVSYPIVQGTSLPVAAPAGGTDVSLRLTFWRPQRRALPDEVTAGAGHWIDMGGLIHYAGNGPNTPCPASAYSNVDPSLTASASGFIDSAQDQPANPHNTFSYTLNLSQCLAAAGLPWDLGQRTSLFFVALLPPVNNQPANGADAGYAFLLCPPPPAAGIGSCPSSLPPSP